MTISGLTSTSVASSSSEHLVELGQHGADRADHVGVDAGLERQAAAVELLEAEQRVDVQAGDRVRIRVGHLLDVHPALGREHHQRRLGRAVEHDRRVVLGGDLGRALDPQLVHGEPADVHAQDRVGVVAGLVVVVRDLDAAGLAPAPDLHLGLDHARVADVVGRRRGLVDGLRVPAGRHGYAVAGEHLLALVLEEIHARLHSSRSRFDGATHGWGPPGAVGAARAFSPWHHGRAMAIPKDVTFVTFDVYGTLIDWETGAFTTRSRPRPSATASRSSATS